jgi:hypothetical protein
MKYLVAFLMLRSLSHGQMSQSISNDVHHSSGGPTIALIQHPNTGATCTGGTTCSLTLTQPITAGDFLVFTSTTSNNVTISSINVGGTLVPCAACQIAGASINTQGGWVLSATSTAGPVVITYSATTGAIAQLVSMWEFSCTSGTVSHDIDGTANNTTDTSPYNGVALSLLGTNDAIVQWSDGVVADPTSITTYGSFTSVNGVGVADLINTASGTAPAWTAAGNSGGKTAAAIAMKCQ